MIITLKMTETILYFAAIFTMKWIHFMQNNTTEPQRRLHIRQQAQ